MSIEQTFTLEIALLITAHNHNYFYKIPSTTFIEPGNRPQQKDLMKGCHKRGSSLMNIEATLGHNMTGRIVVQYKLSSLKIWMQKHKILIQTCSPAVVAW